MKYLWFIYPGLPIWCIPLISLNSGRVQKRAVVEEVFRYLTVKMPHCKWRSRKQGSNIRRPTYQQMHFNMKKNQYEKLFWALCIVQLTFCCRCVCCFCYSYASYSTRSFFCYALCWERILTKVHFS